MHTVFLIVGESGSGKTSIVNELEYRGFAVLQSYTTRPPRYKGETGHIFCSLEEFEQFRLAGEIMAYTYFDGNHYFSTKTQLLESDLYIIDPDGVSFLKEKVKDIDFVTIYIYTREHDRINRMYKRGDTQQMIEQRLVNDVHKFKDVQFDYAITNNNLQQSVDLVEFIIRQNRMEE